MKINYNATAMIARQSLERNNAAQAKSTTKLSTGLKITAAKDDAAGYAVSRKMKAQIRGLDGAKDSADNGISVAEIADGALNEIHEMLQRMNELAVKGANATMTTADRTAISAEIRQLSDEINRIGSTTEFNGEPILDGNYDVRAYSDTYGVRVDDYTDAVPAGKYSFTLTNLGDPTFAATFDSVDAAAGGAEFLANSNVTTDGDTVTVTDNMGKTINFTLDLDRIAADNGGSLPASLAIELDVTGIGEMNIQVGANEGQLLEMRLPEVSLKSLKLTDLDYSTMEGCRKAIDQVADATAKLSEIRSRIGAYQNRLEHTVANLEVSSDNMTAAYSRIMDVDMASEMTEYYTSQVLVQAGTSVLAQANSQPEQVLQLLQ